LNFPKFELLGLVGFCNPNQTMNRPTYTHIFHVKFTDKYLLGGLNDIVITIAGLTSQIFITQEQFMCT
jgi:hypothetical protein